MNKEFVPRTEALALKELRFDLECHFAYTKGARIDTEKPQLFVESIDFNKDHVFVSAPLYQQAFRWFREKYGLDSYTKHLYKSTVKVGYFFCIDETDGIEYHSMEGDLDSGYFKEYEEADLARLRKLIELVKTY